MALVPLTGFATQAVFFLFIGQIFLQIAHLALLGVIIYGIVAAFQLVTLPSRSVLMIAVSVAPSTIWRHCDAVISAGASPLILFTNRFSS